MDEQRNERPAWRKVMAVATWIVLGGMFVALASCGTCMLRI